MYEEHADDGTWNVATTPDGFVEVDVPRVAMTAEEALELSSALSGAVAVVRRAA